ncbi:MAG: hypothetical protein E6J34_07540 [Chloroflexi bacterium]|nr:MAG: hypothetical protein E6J34_07540 [Chloroflexota bacterium]
MQDSPKQRSPRRQVSSANDQRGYEKATSGDTAQSSFSSALTPGITVGIICAVLNVVLTFATAPFQLAVARGGPEVTANTWIAAGLGCLTFLIALFACFVAGFWSGKNTLQRVAGFYAGLLASAIFYICSFLVRYIPNYPGNLTNKTQSSTSLVSGGIIISLVFLIIWGFMGGLMGLWGASLATRQLRLADSSEEE